MNAVERLQAAIEKLEALKAGASGGPWVIAPPRDVEFESRCIWGAKDHGDGEGLCLADAESADADLIVTLHRTIDAQLAILRNVVEVSEYVGLGKEGERIAMIQNALDLADAILGGA